MSRPRKNTVYLALENTFSTDPSVSGASYLHVPAATVGELSDTTEIIDTEWMNGRNRATKALVGRQGWSIDLEGPVIGLDSAAGDMSTPSPSDWFNLILTHVLNDPTNASGDSVNSSNGNDITLNHGMLNEQDLMCVFESGVFASGSDRSQWRAIDQDMGGNVYSTEIDFDPVPSSSAMSYGTANYSPANDEGGSQTLALVADMDGNQYTCLGGRVTSFSITGEVNGYIRFSASISGDRYYEDSSNKTELPSTSAFCSPSPCRALLSPVHFSESTYASPNSMSTPTKRFEINFGIEASEIETTETAQGRSGMESTKLRPTVSIEPLFSNELLDLKRQCESRPGPLLVQMGSGAYDASGNVINSCAFFAPHVQVVDGNSSADGDRRRFPLTFRVIDRGLNGATLYRMFTFARA